jgi:hypothetical protein
MKICIIITLLCWPILRGAIYAQTDYVITWQNDTIPCRLPDKRGKEGIRPAWKYTNGHSKLVVIFSNDSVRIIGAGEVKGYYRAKHGQSLLCNGNFESVQLHSGEPSLTEADGKSEKKWVFLNRVVSGKYASLYIIYYKIRGRVSPAYYVVKHTEKGSPVYMPILNWKLSVKLLADEETGEKLHQFRFTKATRKYRELVEEYNRLKENASFENIQ